MKKNKECTKINIEEENNDPKILQNYPKLIKSNLKELQSDQKVPLFKDQSVTQVQSKETCNDNLKLKFYFPHKEGAVYPSFKRNSETMKTSKSFSESVTKNNPIIPKSRSVLSDSTSTESNAFKVLPKEEFRVSTLKIGSKSSSIVPCCPSLPSSNVSIPTTPTAGIACQGAKQYLFITKKRSKIHHSVFK